MKIIFIVLGCFLGTGVCFGQHEPRKFGDVPIEDLTSKICEIDSGAAAVILFDVVKVTFTSNSYQYECHTRIKILKNTAINSWANVNLVYNKNQKRVYKIKAATYNLVAGQTIVTDLESKNIFETKLTKRVSKLSLALPKVSAGSVIEYTYTISTAESAMVTAIGSIFGLSFSNISWKFQHDIPAYWCEFSVIGGFSASFIQGSIPITETKQEKRHGNGFSSWLVKNVPAFHEEPNSLPESDLIGKIDIARFERTWSQVGSSFLTLQKYGITEKDSSLVRQLANKFHTISNKEVKVDSIVSYVKRNMRWNKDVDQYPDREFGDAFISRYGSSCEINLVMMALLKKAGLKSYPVMLSTRDNGAIAINRPRANQFNDLITAVIIPTTDEKKEKLILLDGTDRYLSDDYIPLRCLNGYGLLIDHESALVPLAVPRSKTTVSATVRLNEFNEEAEAEVDLSFQGLYATDERNSYLSLGENKYDEKLSTSYPSKLGKLTLSNLNEANLPLKVSFRLRSSDLVKFLNDHAYLTPFEFSSSEKNIFQSQSRVFPIDFNPPHEHLYTIKIELPKNYAIEELPKTAAFSLPNNSAKFSYSIVQHDNILYVTSQLIFNRVVFQPDEYSSLREFYSIFLSKQSETIVLKKKSLD